MGGTKFGASKVTDLEDVLEFQIGALEDAKLRLGNALAVGWEPGDWQAQSECAEGAMWGISYMLDALEGLEKRVSELLREAEGKLDKEAICALTGESYRDSVAGIFETQQDPATVALPGSRMVNNQTLVQSTEISTRHRRAER